MHPVRPLPHCQPFQIQHRFLQAKAWMCHERPTIILYIGEVESKALGSYKGKTPAH